MKNGKDYLILFFTADYCMPCKMMKGSVVPKIEEELGVRVKMCDVESDLDLVKAYNVRSVPTFVILKEDEVVNVLVGIRNLEDFRRICV